MRISQYQPTTRHKLGVQISIGRFVVTLRFPVRLIFTNIWLYRVKRFYIVFCLNAIITFLIISLSLFPFICTALFPLQLTSITRHLNIHSFLTHMIVHTVHLSCFRSTSSLIIYYIHLYIPYSFCHKTFFPPHALPTSPSHIISNIARSKAPKSS